MKKGQSDRPFLAGVFKLFTWTLRIYNAIWYTLYRILWLYLFGWAALDVLNLISKYFLMGILVFKFQYVHRTQTLPNDVTHITLY